MKIEGNGLRRRGVSFVFEAVVSATRLSETVISKRTVSKTTRGDGLNRPND
jgi:hypothetical protein